MKYIYIYILSVDFVTLTYEDLVHFCITCRGNR